MPFKLRSEISVRIRQGRRKQEKQKVLLRRNSTCKGQGAGNTVVHLRAGAGRGSGGVPGVWPGRMQNSKRHG